MQNWIEHLKEPLVLGGFVLLIFAGVFKLMLGKKNSADLWHKALNYLFVLAVLAIGLAFFKTSSAPTVVLPTPVPASSSVTAPMSAPVPASPSSVNQAPVGDCSPAIVAGGNVSVNCKKEAPPPSTIKQSTKGNNSAARIEGVKLDHKNVDQSTRGNNSPAIIKGD